MTSHVTSHDKICHIKIIISYKMLQIRLTHILTIHPNTRTSNAYKKMNTLLHILHEIFIVIRRLFFVTPTIPDI